MKIEIDLDDVIIEKFITSYTKDFLYGYTKDYMKSVEELVHEAIAAFMKTDFVLEHGGILLDIKLLEAMKK